MGNLLAGDGDDTDVILWPSCQRHHPARTAPPQALPDPFKVIMILLFHAHGRDDHSPAGKAPTATSPLLIRIERAKVGHESLRQTFCQDQGGYRRVAKSLLNSDNT
jgi:hypothetical protein